MKPTTTRAARTLAPEDIRPGMYVTAMFIIDEDLPLFDASDVRDERVRPLRWRRAPWATAPGRVVDVCLPFVLIEEPSGDPVQVDVRRTILARLSKRYGRSAFTARTPDPCADCAKSGPKKGR
ncbi:MAG: hypothetical protein EA376_12125 [Phycisphaeraceae bacterium]|nr:MAG: hypothetical protein EA376_12125 [Phycisphaeraceae bacterium]